MIFEGALRSKSAFADAFKITQCFLKAVQSLIVFHLIIQLTLLAFSAGFNRL